ncbi:hypothetical protein [Teredinibacter turnerae]|uniref:hypothetical protein n=1 Tax=Teredinibacter turnerae TaxID=2426 RepID=UPI0030D37FBB
MRCYWAKSDTESQFGANPNIGADVLLTYCIFRLAAFLLERVATPELKNFEKWLFYQKVKI